MKIVAYLKVIVGFVFFLESGDDFFDESSGLGRVLGLHLGR